MQKKRLQHRPILLAFLILLLVLGALVARKYLFTSAPRPLPVAEVSGPKALREVVLYFGSADGSHLVPEGREIEDCLEERACLMETVRALIAGPVGDLTPVFPSHAVLLDIVEEGGTAQVDFSGDLVTGHPGGSISELLTIYSLANTLSENFPYVRQVQILVDGAPIETLKGHVDLREPVKADFTYGRPSQGTPPAAGSREETQR
ncbi:hypothetical protein DSOUD_0653 [Desulfuromonas soudanensis]|uniref:GerMN domain-containing protein n=1 Tax=Desulfuromonas soudanensis TaxID=1603606 RepID=A0A0M4CUZ3_9BACT|nr:GerMN domain-containing protein [Desulfuromonas soudanensis]ALC15441.1 hypothetical protein DSOUD_0653 [Desulfuromonas soudanensis]